MHRLRPVLATVVLCAVMSTGAAPAHSATVSTASPDKTQLLAELTEAQESFSRPLYGAARRGLVRGRRPLTGGSTVLPVLEGRTGDDGLRWLRVKLPGRPNGRSGWIRERGTVASTTSWRVVVDTSERRVTFYDNGRSVRSVRAVVGKPSTPTPNGEFFVEEVIQLRRTMVGAPFALALSAHSDVLQEFNGGPGQIGIHGLANVGGVLGTAVSHGCVRLDSRTMRWLVLHIAPGTPVTITT